MEKIKTPFQLLLEKLNEIEKYKVSKLPIKDIRVWIQELQTTEFHMIEKTYKDGRRSAWPLEESGKRNYIARDYFTQTFESYE